MILHAIRCSEPIQMRCVLQISSRSHRATAIAWQHKQHEKEMTRMSLNGKAKWHQCRVPFSGRGLPSLVCLTAFGSAIQHRGHSVAFLEKSIFDQMWYRRANIFCPPCSSLWACLVAHVICNPPCHSRRFSLVCHDDFGNLPCVAFWGKNAALRCLACRARHQGFHGPGTPHGAFFETDTGAYFVTGLVFKKFGLRPELYGKVNAIWPIRPDRPSSI